MIRAALATASQPLPHRAQIQEGFGRHDLSDVRTATGGVAQKTCEALGALAFTSGNRIVFRDAPDVALVAHEAAHVIQQRWGVVPSAGVFDTDPYEVHADRVASAVAAGSSAEALLDAIGGNAPWTPMAPSAGGDVVQFWDTTGESEHDEGDGETEDREPLGETDSATALSAEVANALDQFYARDQTSAAAIEDLENDFARQRERALRLLPPLHVSLDAFVGAAGAADQLFEAMAGSAFSGGSIVTWLDAVVMAVGQLGPALDAAQTAAPWLPSVGLLRRRQTELSNATRATYDRVRPGRRLLARAARSLRTGYATDEDIALADRIDAALLDGRETGEAIAERARNLHEALVPDISSVHPITDERTAALGFVLHCRMGQRGALFRSYRHQFERTLFEDFFAYAAEATCRVVVGLLRPEVTATDRRDLDTLNAATRAAYGWVESLTALMQGAGTQVEVESNLAALTPLDRVRIIIALDYSDSVIISELERVPPEQRSSLAGSSGFIGLLRQALDSEHLYEARKLLNPSDIFDAARERLTSAFRWSDDEQVVYDVFLDLPRNSRSQMLREFRDDIGDGSECAQAGVALDIAMGALELGVGAASPAHVPAISSLVISFHRAAVSYVGRALHADCQLYTTLDAIVSNDELSGLLARLGVAQTPEDRERILERVNRLVGLDAAASPSGLDGPPDYDSAMRAFEQLSEYGLAPGEATRELHSDDMVQALVTSFAADPAGGMRHAVSYGIAPEYFGRTLALNATFSEALGMLALVTDREVRSRLIRGPQATAWLSALPPARSEAIRAYCDASGDALPLSHTPGWFAPAIAAVDLVEAGADFDELMLYLVSLSLDERRRVNAIHRGPFSLHDAITEHWEQYEDGERVLLRYFLSTTPIELHELIWFVSLVSIRQPAAYLGAVSDLLSIEARDTLRRGYTVFSGRRYSAHLRVVARDEDEASAHAYEEFSSIASRHLNAAEYQELLDRMLGAYDPAAFAVLRPISDENTPAENAEDNESLTRSPDQRRDIADFLLARVLDRQSLETDWVVEGFMTEDEELALSARDFRDAYQSALQVDGVGVGEFIWLTELERTTRARAAGFVGARNAVAEAAANYAGIAAGLVVGVCFPHITLIGVLAGGLAVGGTRSVVSAVARGTSLYDEEATAREFTEGAFEGALGVISNGLSTRFVSHFLGAAGAATAREAVVEVTETALGRIGRGVAREALEGAIDGLIGGAAAGVVYTALDENNWRRGILEGIGNVIHNAVVQGMLGAASGAAMSVVFAAPTSVLSELSDVVRARIRRMDVPDAEGGGVFDPDTAAFELNSALHATAADQGITVDAITRLELPGPPPVHWTRDVNGRWCRHCTPGCLTSLATAETSGDGTARAASAEPSTHAAPSRRGPLGSPSTHGEGSVLGTSDPRTRTANPLYPPGTAIDYLNNHLTRSGRAERGIDVLIDFGGDFEPNSRITQLNAWLGSDSRAGRRLREVLYADGLNPARLEAYYEAWRARPSPRGTFADFVGRMVGFRVDNPLVEVAFGNPNFRELPIRDQNRLIFDWVAPGILDRPGPLLDYINSRLDDPLFSSRELRVGQAERRARRILREYAESRAFDYVLRNQGRLSGSAGMVEAYYRTLFGSTTLRRAAAGELRIIARLLSDPDVTRVDVVASSSAGVSYDLLVTRTSQAYPTEILTITRNRPVVGITETIIEKIEHGQLLAVFEETTLGAYTRVSVNDPPRGGMLTVNILHHSGDIMQFAREIQAGVSGALSSHPEVHRLDLHFSAGRVVRIHPLPIASVSH